MYLINTSFHAVRAVSDGVIDDVRSKLLPAMAGSGLFDDLTMAEILVQVDPESTSFTLQGKSSDLDKAMEWLHGDGSEFFNGLQRKYGQNVVYFTTPMRIL